MMTSRLLSLMIFPAMIGAIFASGCSVSDENKSPEPDISLSQENLGYDDKCRDCHDASSRPKSVTYSGQLVERGQDSTEDAPSISLMGPYQASPLENLSVHYRNFMLRDAMGADNALGEGHIAWSVDGILSVETVDIGFELKDLKEGDYEIRAELHQNGHESLDPPVVVTRHVTIKEKQDEPVPDYMVPTTPDEEARSSWKSHKSASVTPLQDPSSRHSDIEVSADNS